MCTTRPLPRRGDVESVASGEPNHPHGTDGGRVIIRLVDHQATYSVRVAIERATEPKMTELTITADVGEAVDYDALRSVPARRLAHTAAQWLHRAGGRLAFPDDTAESRAQPENHDSKAHRAARIANDALALGLPVRPTVAAELNVSTKTVSRLLAKARSEGWFSDDPLPRRPQPQQRDINPEETK
ncbi:hypothetical protein [Rhodococcus sp. EPR-157]|uniref:hypothetical protein n=1 Tax=Rhodococcus sp. EPR-157 TaxID=1813677 RepID=UPI000A801146|nr:hypothetical protein [Rhodococcus sp. EPR-157]